MRISLSTVALNHPQGAVGYRVNFGGRSVCYITDTEHKAGEIDQNIKSLVSGSDLVIYDACFTDENYPNFAGWGHSTWQEGVKLCDGFSKKARNFSMTQEMMMLQWILSPKRPIKPDRAL